MAVNMLLLQPLVALVAGLLVLIFPRVLNYVVALYLIVIGVAGVLSQIIQTGV
jgi:hypothetical protein